MIPNHKAAFICALALLSLQLILASSSSINVQQNQTLQISNLTKNCSFPTFDEFVIKFKKNYTVQGTEYLRRKQTYEKRVEQLKITCEDPSIDYQVGVNKFSDLTDEERAKRKPLLNNDQESKKVSSSGIIKVKQSSGAPTSLDWRTRNVITSIKDQGECGSCWTFATNAYGQSRMILKNLSDINIDLSQQYLLSCTPDCTCEGGYLEYVFEKAATGVPLQSSHPYAPYSLVSPFICWASDKKYFGYIPQKHYDLTASQLISLLQVGPVAISISATNWEDYKSGVFRCKSFDKVNHAVLLIGYTTDYWIVKNQWGTDWGENGFIRVSRNSLSNCKIGASAFVMWQKVYGGFMLLMAIVALVWN